MNNVMVDLETLGVSYNAVILSIGAVEFDETGIGRKFYMNVNPQSCVDAGLEINPDTVMWWMKQSEKARSAFNEKSNDLYDVLTVFSSWFPKEACLWGNGATFDNVILTNAYRKIDIKQPWSYSKDRCYRTLKSLFPDVKPDEDVGTAHNALDDAIYQAQHAAKILKVLKGS